MSKLNLVIIVIILFIYLNYVDINKYRTYNQNQEFFKVVDAMENIDLTIDNISTELQPYFMLPYESVKCIHFFFN